MKKLGKLLFITSLLLCFLIPRGWTQTQAKNQPDSIELKLKEIYTKREVMIPMRDGIKLYTAVYEPKDNSRQHPILMHRSPYSCSPYGEGFDRHFRTNLKNYIEHDILSSSKMYVDGIRVKGYLSKYALSTKTKRVRKIKRI